MTALNHDAVVVVGDGAQPWRPADWGLIYGQARDVWLVKYGVWVR